MHEIILCGFNVNSQNDELGLMPQLVENGSGIGFESRSIWSFMSAETPFCFTTYLQIVIKYGLRVYSV